MDKTFSVNIETNQVKQKKQNPAITIFNPFISYS